MLHLIPGVRSTAAALDAERTRLDIIAENIANTNTTRGINGRPYQRQQVVFAQSLAMAQNGQPSTAGPQVSKIQNDTRPGRTVYLPGHPDANAQGIVEMPNVDVQEEMADLIVAGRTFEANLAVLKTARQMTGQALNIGKR